MNQTTAVKPSNQWSTVISPVIGVISSAGYIYNLSQSMKSSESCYWSLLFIKRGCVSCVPGQNVPGIGTSNHPAPPLPCSLTVLYIGTQQGLWEMCVSEAQLVQASSYQREKGRVGWCVWMICVWVLMCWSVITVCVCVCVSVADLSPNRHQMAPNPEAWSDNSRRLHVCHPHPSLSLSPFLFRL